MKRSNKFVVHVLVGRTNRNRVALADTARRQADYLGPHGICAKCGQTDEEFRKHNRLRLVFRSLETARKFEERVAENCDEIVTTKRYRVSI